MNELYKADILDLHHWANQSARNENKINNISLFINVHEYTREIRVPPPHANRKQAPVTDVTLNLH